MSLTIHCFLCLATLNYGGGDTQADSGHPESCRRKQAVLSLQQSSYQLNAEIQIPFKGYFAQSTIE